MAFHPYPQLIPKVFSPNGFGPPQSFTFASTWPWIDHSVSGLIRTTYALLRLAFATATLSLNLAVQINSLTHYAKGTRSHNASIVLPQLVGTGFQVLFTPLTEVLFTFPSRYWFAIGRWRVLSLGRWSSRIPTRFHVSRSTQVPACSLSISDTGLSPALARLSRRFSCLIMDPL